jgi:hypothetical protein
VAVGSALLQDAGAGAEGLRTGPHPPNNVQAKPARDVRVGDMLLIKNEGGEFEVEVLVLSEMRGPAAVAQTLYRETEASKDARLKRPPSARPCRSLLRCRSAGPPSATAARSSSFAAKDRPGSKAFKAVGAALHRCLPSSRFAQLAQAGMILQLQLDGVKAGCGDCG